jgi:hypothetical protein
MAACRAEWAEWVEWICKFADSSHAGPQRNRPAAQSGMRQTISLG